MEKDKKSLGEPIDVSLLNIALYGVADPDAVYIDYAKLWEISTKKISNKNLGIAMITSTVPKSHNHFFELWNRAKDDFDKSLHSVFIPADRNIFNENGFLKSDL